MPSTTHSPAIKRRRLGHEIKRIRTDQSMKAEELAALTGLDRSKISRIENGRQRPDLAEIMKILEALGVAKSQFDELVQIAREASDKGWWKSLTGPTLERQRQLAELESGATEIREVSTMFVPGLLQTEEYCRVRFADSPTFPTTDEVQGGVEARLARQRLLDDLDRSYEVVIEEAALLRRSCAGDTMRRQVEHMIEVGKRPNISIRVLPVTAPVYERTGLLGPFVLLSYADPEDPKIAFIETLTADYALDDADDVAWYERVFSELRHASLPAEDSAEFLTSFARRIDW